MSQRRLLIVCQELPFPAKHGGTVDMLRRIQALSRQGVSIYLICWHPDPKEESIISAINELHKWVSQVDVLPYQQGLMNRLPLLFNYLLYPAPVCTRWVYARQLNSLANKVREFAPQFILQDGLMAGYVAQQLGKRLQIPLLIRSHNIEHLYWKRQLGVAKFGIAWVKCFLRLTGVKRFELNGLRTAKYFFDISQDDLYFWRSLGLLNGFLLPPLVPAEQVDINSHVACSPCFDLAFIGNLRMPNNVDALCWLIEEIMPSYQNKFGENISLLVAGSSPIPKVIKLAERKGVTLLADFSSLTEVLGAAKVLVNPMLAGSGVALKSIDMLRTGKRVISTKQGVSGLPAAIKALAVVVSDADEFVDEIHSALLAENDEQASRNQIELVNRTFGDTSLAPLLKLWSQDATGA